MSCPAGQGDRRGQATSGRGRRDRNLAEGIAADTRRLAVRKPDVWTNVGVAELMQGTLNNDLEGLERAVALLKTFPAH